MTPSENCFALIKEFEGLAKVRPDGLVQAYPDPATGGAPWTIGYGTTGADVHRDTVWTVEQCTERFEADVTAFAEGVSRLVADHTTQGQLDALVSFAYNLGTRALRDSTLLALHNRGKKDAAAHEFTKWVFAGGKRMRGLMRRRAAEAVLYRAAV